MVILYYLNKCCVSFAIRYLQQLLNKQHFYVLVIRSIRITWSGLLLPDPLKTLTVVLRTESNKVVLLYYNDISQSFASPTFFSVQNNRLHIVQVLINSDLNHYSCMNTNLILSPTNNIALKLENVWLKTLLLF